MGHEIYSIIASMLPDTFRLSFLVLMPVLMSRPPHGRCSPTSTTKRSTLPCSALNLMGAPKVEAKVIELTIDDILAA